MYLSMVASEISCPMECFDRLLHPFERDHLCNDHIEDIGLDARAVLQGTGHVGWKAPLCACLTVGAFLNLDIHVANHFFEDNIDLRASFIPDTGGFCEILAAGFTDMDFGDLNGFYRSGVTAAHVVLAPCPCLCCQGGSLRYRPWLSARRVCWNFCCLWSYIFP